MPDTSIDALVKQAISANPVLAKLLEAKAHSDKSRYELKNQILKELMDQSPEDWVIDDPKPKYKGVTHLPTKFRLHADPRFINPNVKIQSSIEDLAKQAAAYTVSGEKVQGVGLRKLYHQLLDEQKLPGLAVNNEETGDVELTFGGDEEKRKKVFDELARRIQAKTQHPVSYQALLGDSNLLPINLKNSDIAKINARNHLAYRMSKYYNPADSQMKPDSQTQAELAERFRLTPKGKGLIGNVSPRAMDQLLGKRPMYQAMLPANLIRGMDETLQETPEDIRNRILKTLKTDKGFLASSIPDLAKQAALQEDVQPSVL